MKILTFLMSLSVSVAMAAPSGEQGSLSDLALPAWNFGLLIVLLFVFVRKPIKEMFKNDAAEVESLYKHAEEKAREAQIRFTQNQEKLNNLDADAKKKLDEAQENAIKLEQQIGQETQLQLAKLERESAQKAEHEKDMLVSELNESLLDEVIKRAKANIKSDKELQNKATSRLISEVQ